MTADWWHCEVNDGGYVKGVVWCWIWVTHQPSHYWCLGQSSRTSRNEILLFHVKHSSSLNTGLLEEIMVIKTTAMTMLPTLHGSPYETF